MYVSLFLDMNDLNFGLWITTVLIYFVCGVKETKHLECFIFYSWNDISTLSYNKRLFCIETSNKDTSMQFQMDDAETAKYVWRMCKLQQQFQKYSLERDK